MRIHWSFSLLRFTAVGDFFLLPVVCSHLPTCFPFVVWIATTIHSVQSSRNPSVDIGNNFYFIIFVRHSISASLPYLRLTHLRRLLRRTFDVQLGSRKKRMPSSVDERMSISSHQVAARSCTDTEWTRSTPKSFHRLAKGDRSCQQYAYNDHIPVQQQQSNYQQKPSEDSNDAESPTRRKSMLGLIKHLIK